MVAAAGDLFGLPAHAAASGHLFGFNLACEDLAEGSAAPTSSGTSPRRCAPGARSFAQISHNKITQSCFRLPDSLMNAVTCLSDAGSLLFLLPLCASSHFLLPLSLAKSHATTLGGSMCLDLIDGPRAFLLTKALPNMVSYRGIMLSCHSIWGGDPLCQS